MPQPIHIVDFSGNVKYFSIDVECVATGTDHNSRSVAQLSLVNQAEQVLLNIYVKPDKPVASYLTPLTGLTAEVIEQQGVSFQDAVDTLRKHLPSDAVLVGQNIGKDVEWLGLKQGVDFEGMLDLSGLYRVWNPRFNSWSVFGQDHVATVLLGMNTVGVSHDAVGDAIKSMRLFNLYKELQEAPEKLGYAQQQLLESRIEPSFAKKNPSFEGVCMGNRRTCTCGAPFFS